MKHLENSFSEVLQRNTYSSSEKRICEISGICESPHKKIREISAIRVQKRDLCSKEKLVVFEYFDVKRKK